MESYSLNRKLHDVFDSYLSTVLLSYLSFDDCMSTLIKLNKHFNSILNGGVDFIWK